MANTEPASTSTRRARQLLPPRAQRSLAATSRRPAYVYVRCAAAGPWQLVIVAGCIVLGYAQCSFWGPLFAFAGAEGVLLLIASRLPFFRRVIDARIARAAQRRAAEQRATLLARMGDEHRRELTMLEGVFDRIRDVAEPRGVAAGAVVEECRHLLASFVRLAIACHASRECLAAVDRAKLAEDCRALEAAAAAPLRGGVELAGQRLVVVRRRIDRWERTRETLGVLLQRLALIGDLVRLAHEQIAAPGDPERETGGVLLDGTVEEAEEMAELLRVEPVFEPEVLELGRAAIAREVAAYAAR